MKIRVTTITDDFEDVEALFEVFPGMHKEIEAEFLEAHMLTHTGRKTSLTMEQLAAFKVLAELYDDAILKFDPIEHDAEISATIADMHQDL